MARQGKAWLGKAGQGKELFRFSVNGTSNSAICDGNIIRGPARPGMAGLGKARQGKANFYLRGNKNDSSKDCKTHRHY